MESISYRRPEVVMMAEKSNEAKGTSVSAPDMDPESRRLFGVRKVQKGRNPSLESVISSRDLTITGGVRGVLRASSAESMSQKEPSPR